MGSTIVTLRLGDREVDVMAAPMATLQAVLRDQLGHTGTKEGCRQGGCGSCTVLVDGEPVLSCLLPIEDVEGRRVDTIETIAGPGEVHPIQRAFLDRLAFQCGYCTPGMVMVTKALLDRDPAPTRERIADALGGNICRCTGYEPILEAVEEAAAALAGRTSSTTAPTASGVPASVTPTATPPATPILSTSPTPPTPPSPDRAAR